MKKYFVAFALSSLFLIYNDAAFAKPKPTKIEKLISSNEMKVAKQTLENDFERIITDTINLTQIPSPPHGETNRAKFFMEQLKNHGLSDVEMDEEGNVMGLRKGKGSGPLLVVAAHLDTVFPIETNVTVRKDGNKLYAPGIGDDTVSLSIMLGIIRAMDAAKLSTKGDILFVGNVGEEGPGNLRGTRFLFNKGKYKDKIKHFISLEPGIAGEVVNQGIGSKRYKVEFLGPGGHSFGDFGIVNPAYAMADAITRFSKYPEPLVDNTVFNVGILSGGTSVNSIPFSVSMSVDMRSASDKELNKIADYFLAQLPLAAKLENETRSISRGTITYKTTTIGERPSGKTPEDSPLTKITQEIYAKMGFKYSTHASSTDSNVPMSLGIDALTLGSGIGGDGAHSLNEYIEIDKPNNINSILSNIAIIYQISNGE